MSLLVSFLLATAAASPSPTASVNPLDKVKCVREQVTGSLVSVRKVCHTQREWNQIHNDADVETRRIAQPGSLNDLNGR